MEIVNFIDLLTRRSGATDALITQSERELNVKLPDDYLALIRSTNGAEDFVGSSAYLVLFPVDELGAVNLAYNVAANAPGLLIFGSDGGGEAYGFDARCLDWPVVQVPFVGMNWRSAIAAGDSFAEFLQRLQAVE